MVFCERRAGGSAQRQARSKQHRHFCPLPLASSPGAGVKQQSPRPSALAEIRGCCQLAETPHRSKFLCVHHGYPAASFLWGQSVHHGGRGGVCGSTFLAWKRNAPACFLQDGPFPKPAFWSLFCWRKCAVLVKVTKKNGKTSERASDLRKGRVRRGALHPTPAADASAGAAGTAEGDGVEGATARPQLLLTTPPLGRLGRRNTGRRAIVVLVLVLVLCLFLLLFLVLLYLLLLLLLRRWSWDAACSAATCTSGARPSCRVPPAVRAASEPLALLRTLSSSSPPPRPRPWRRRRPRSPRAARRSPRSSARRSRA